MARAWAKKTGWGAPLSGLGAIDLQAAEEEEDEKNDQYQAESATESSSTMAPVPVVPHLRRRAARSPGE